MYRKHKLQLLAGIMMPILFFGVAAIVLFFPHQILKFSKFSYGLGIFSLLFLILPIGRYRIGGKQAAPKVSLWCWLLLILFLEFVFIFLFLGQYAFLFHYTIKPYAQVNGVSEAVHYLFYNYGLFPWGLLAAVAVIFAYVSYQKAPFWPFSFLLTNLFKRKAFFAHSIEAIIAIYFRLIASYFVAFTTVITALIIAALITHFHASLLQPITGMLVSMILFALYFRWFSDSTFKHFSNKRYAVGILVLFSIVVMAILISLTNSILFSWVAPYLPEKLLRQPAIVISLPTLNVLTMWRLWNWGWWLLALPCLASLLIKYSYGRKIYLFLLAVLILPALCWASFFFYSSYLIHFVIQNSLSLLYGLSLFAAVGFIVLLFQKDNQDYLYLGFWPAQRLKKKHGAVLQQLWMFMVVVVALLLMLGLRYNQLLVVVGVLPEVIVLIVLLVLGCMSCRDRF